METLRTMPWWVIVTCIALALLIESPLIAFPYYAGEEYQGINIAHFGNDEHHYLTRAKEVLEGHSLGQMYLAESKNLPDSFQSNIEQIVLFPIVAAGYGDSVPVVPLYNVLNAVGIFVLLLLVYAFMYGLSGSRILALSCSVFMIGGYALVESGTILYSIFVHGELFYSNFNIYGRSAFPYMALVPFFGFLILTYRAAMGPSFSVQAIRTDWKPYGYTLGAGVLFGLLFYDYFYAWTFALAFIASLALTSIIWRRWQALFAVLFIGAIGILIGSLKLIGYYRLFTSPLGEQVAYFFMTVHARPFIMSMTGLATALLFAAYWYVRRNDVNNFFIAAGIAAGWIALEQQLVTGRMVQYGHYYWYFVAPLCIVFSVYMAARLMPEKWPQARKWFPILLIIAAFVNTIGGQYRSFWTTVPGKMREQAFAPLVQKLQNMPSGVVLGDFGGESYPFMVTIFTDNDIYWLPAASTSAFPIEHAREALFVYLYLNKEARRDPEGYLRKTLTGQRPTAYTDLYEIVEGFEFGIPRRLYEKMPFPHTDASIVAVRAPFLKKLEEEYREFAKSDKSVRAALERRGVKYVLWDARVYPEWDLSVLAPMTVIATSTDIALYSLSTSR